MSQIGPREVIFGLDMDFTKRSAITITYLTLKLSWLKNHHVNFVYGIFSSRFLYILVENFVVRNIT